MPDQTRALVDELRFRIADPGAYLPRRINGVGAPDETIASWAARAIIHGVTHGQIGLAFPEEREQLTAKLGRIRTLIDQYGNRPAAPGVISLIDKLDAILNGTAPATVAVSAEADRG